ncbi:hypothetical protein EDC01DRAFT_625837 [Geopyxis carbonaria]|nr:hypothetical protein EDC01DRAFT_625837 [Geopyxis carbonaria]
MISDNDIKAVFRLCVSQNASHLPAPPACFELTSGSGVILEQTAREDIEKYVIGGPNGWFVPSTYFHGGFIDVNIGKARTSIFEIASELSLEPTVVERLLPLKTPNWGRVGDSIIVREKEFLRLREKLEDEINHGVVQISNFCQLYQIDSQLFRRLLSASNASWAWLGQDMSSVYGSEFYENTREQFKTVLQAAERPTNLTELLPGVVFSTAFSNKLVYDLIKCRDITGHLAAGSFVPEIYVAKRHASLIEELHTEGVIGLEVLKSEGIKEPQEFVRSRAPDAVLLAHHFVTPRFMANVEGLVKHRVETHDWSNVKLSGCKDPDNRLSTQDEQILRDRLVRAMPEYVVVEGVLVHKNLETNLREVCRKYARQKAEIAWKKRSNEVPALKRQDVSKQLSSGMSFPAAVVSYFTNRLYPYCLLQFNQRIEELQRIETNLAKATFVDKYCLRYLLHREGLRGIDDKSLRSKLAAYLLEFARDNGIAMGEKLEAALVDDPDSDPRPLHELISSLKNTAEERKPEHRLEEIDKAIPTILSSLNVEYPQTDIVLRKKRGIMGEMNSQLQSGTELSLQLLLAILLLHASRKGGVIRATGIFKVDASSDHARTDRKYVPKLLKEVQNSNIVTDEQVALLNSAKAAAMGKGSMSESDMQALRDIGSQCLENAAEESK